MGKLSKEEAMDELSELRGGRRGSSSMFAPWLEDIRDLGEDEAFTETVDGYNRVTGLRRYLENNLDGEVTVKSAKHPEDQGKEKNEARYKVFVFRTDEE